MGPELEALIKAGFEGEYGQDRLSRALQLVKLSGGLDAARALARREADEVRTCCPSFFLESARPADKAAAGCLKAAERHAA